MQIVLKIKDIDLIIHELIELIHISIYFFEIAKNKSMIFVNITKKIYLIDKY